jgi:MFS family permease
MSANPGTGPTQAETAVPQRPLPGARPALVLLLAINLFNFIDRQVLAAVEPEIRKDFFPEDPHEGLFWTGYLSSAFMVTYMVTAPLFGWLADRWPRWYLVAIGVLLWSLASGASGWAATFLLLLLTRCFVGIGEAVYGPVAPTMIADLYPVRVRGSVLAWFYAAIPVGSALGYTLGGQVVAAGWSWRWAFYLVVPPGLLLGLWCFLMREPPRGQADVAPGHLPGQAKLADYLVLLRTPSYVLDTLGMTALTFALGGIAYWMPAYIAEYRNVPGLGGVDSRTVLGVIAATSGLVATLVGGIAGDVLRARFPGSYFLVSGAAMLAAFPLILLVLVTPFPWAWIFLTLAVFCLFFNTGPTNTILANVTHPSIRATGFAVNILVIHALGDVLSPPVIGAIAASSNLDVGFQVVSVLVLVGGVLWLWGARYLERDTALAPHRLAG